MNSAHPTSQPKGLYLLFFTELWERFGFYTLQTLLILYMTKALAMPDDKANIFYAAFSSLLYLTPAVGGYLADRYLGFQRAIILGGILLLIGYIVTAIPGKLFFFCGLSILIVANGFFKPNVSAIVGELYQPNDARREGGFTLFYMGINIGALIPPLLAGAIVVNYGWHAGFLLAAAGMAIGQITFIFGRKMLNGAGLHPKMAKVPTPLSSQFWILLTLGIFVTIGLCIVAFHYSFIVNTLVEVFTVILLATLAVIIFKEPLQQRRRMFACLILIIISIGFWSLYTQSFTSLMLFADRNMGTKILGIPLDAEATQFFNPFFIIALSPVLSRLWIKLDGFNLNPSIQTKFSLGILFMSLGYLLLAVGAKYYGTDGITSAWWLCGSYFLQTIGELLISPIGLAMITVLCPRHLVGLMMGVWFFSQATSFALGGELANLAALPANLPAVDSLPVYGHAFSVYGYIALGVAAVSFALIPFLKRLINEQNVIMS
jgi:POT family proton-dependent oligopeptide transporter